MQHINIQTKLINNKVYLIDILSCPAYFTFKGKCNNCRFNQDNIKCTIKTCFKPIEELNNLSLCPSCIERKNGGHCNHCDEFLSFTSNGFYCNAKT